MNKKLSNATRLYLAILVNLLVTVSIWVFVYDMQEDPQLIPVYLLSKKTDFTTGNELLDGLLNGINSIILIAVISFGMLVFIIYNFKNLIEYWLYLASLCVLWGLSPYIIKDLLVKLHLDDEMHTLTCIATTIYAGVGTLVFLTNRMPLELHQIYVICNCSMISVFYLRAFPEHTIWFLLSLIIFWDIFAVLAPNGPLRMAQNRAAEYSNTVLKMLMFEAKMDRPIETSIDASEEEQLIVHEISDARTAESISDERLQELKKMDTEIDEQQESVQPIKERSAAEAISDPNTLHLGMGDFVFYSVLVGKSLASGGVPCGISSAVGVFVGFFITDTFFPQGHTYPALPVSLFFGLILHFSVQFLVLPQLSQ